MHFYILHCKNAQFIVVTFEVRLCCCCTALLLLQSVRKFLQKSVDEERAVVLGVAIKSNTITNGLK
jgi:hypothetical protein